MPDSRDELEARVARLERLLNQVLGLVQEMKTEPGRTEEDGGEPQEEVPWSVLQAELEAAAKAHESEAVDPGGVEVEEEQSQPTAEELAPPEPEPEPQRSGAEPPSPDREALHSSPDPSQREQATGGARSYAEGEAIQDFLEKMGIFPLRGVFLARLGIVLLLLSVAYFFKYSIDQGWLVPAIRLALGVALGIALVAMGFKGASKGEPLGTVLAGGGIATFFITGYTGHQWYSLVSYPVAFSFLVAASALGIFLSLRSGLQALALVGLIGALGTPLILTPERAEVAGLALYVSLVVASVGAVYLLKAWRALMVSAAVLTWAVLAWTVFRSTFLVASLSTAASWALQGAIAFCALVFWLVPLYRAGLRARNPGRWPRPESAYDDTGAGPYGMWNIHLDALSILVPLTAITLSTWLWELSRIQLGWVVLATALFAQGVGWWLLRTSDPEDSASTQTFTAILLSTFGIGLILTGDVLYLAFVAEAVALFWLADRRQSRLFFGFGSAVQLVVLFIFLFRLAEDRLVGVDPVSIGPDLAAIGAAGFIGFRLMGETGRGIFYSGAYLGLLAIIGWELWDQPSLLYLAYLLLGVATHVLGGRVKDEILENLSYVAFGLVLLFFLSGMESGRTLLAGDLTLLVDLAALSGTVYLGLTARKEELRVGFLACAYLGLLAVLGRELAEHLTILYLAILAGAALTQVLAAKAKSSFWSGMGHLPMLIGLGFFWNGMGSGRHLVGGELTSLVDLAALGCGAYIGTLLSPKQGKAAYLYGAYAGLLLWVGRELYPLEQGQAWMSLAFGLQGAVALVAGLVLDRSQLQKLGVGTLLLVVGKVLLVDMAAVEPIWRVLLLFVFGGLFLLLSKFVQGRKPGAEEGGQVEPPEPPS